jgi:hypothetical protein
VSAGRKLLAAVAVIVAAGSVGIALLGQGYHDYGPAINDALADYRANEGRADTAPQQEVVNGWAARDLLEIQARQLNEMTEMNARLTWLLAAIALLSAVAVLANASRRTPDPAPVRGPPPPLPR